MRDIKKKLGVFFVTEKIEFVCVYLFDHVLVSDRHDVGCHSDNLSEHLVEVGQRIVTSSSCDP